MIKSSIKNTSKISVSCDISEVPKVNCTIVFRRQEQDIGPIGSIKFQKNRPIASGKISIISNKGGLAESKNIALVLKENSVVDKLAFLKDVKNLCWIHLLIKITLSHPLIIFSLSFVDIEPLNDSGSLWNIHFILVRPQLGENIGSVARAIKNFNIKNLRILTLN